jgi:hypothetical protein
VPTLTQTVGRDIQPVGEMGCKQQLNLDHAEICVSYIDGSSACALKILPVLETLERGKRLSQSQPRNPSNVYYLASEPLVDFLLAQPVPI